MDASDQERDPPSDREGQPKFEDALSRLERIVHDLEEGDLGLAEALGRYESGVGLLKQCYGLLEHAERRIELLSGVDREGNPVSMPFDDAATSLEDKPQVRSRRRSAGAKSGEKPSKAAPPPIADVDEPPSLF